MRPRKVAIFDVDGTIFRSSLFVELVEALIREGIFPARAREKYIKQYSDWVNRQGSYEEYVQAMIRSFDTHIQGVLYKDFLAVGKKVLETHQDRVYRYTRDLIGEMKRKNYFLLAISQSPKGILDSFCERLGFDKVYGRIYELGPQDRLTGSVVDFHLIVNKANVVRRAVEKEGLTLKGSVGVGDTEGDISFLEMVEKPICFNPNATLYRHAKRLGWKVVVERKDVIYEIGA